VEIIRPVITAAVHFEIRFIAFPPWKSVQGKSREEL